MSQADKCYIMLTFQIISMPLVRSNNEFEWFTWQLNRSVQIKIIYYVWPFPCFFFFYISAIVVCMLHGSWIVKVSTSAGSRLTSGSQSNRGGTLRIPRGTMHLTVRGERGHSTDKRLNIFTSVR